jgi:hypothetical protein
MHKEWCCKITLDRPLPEDTSGMMLNDVTRLPKVEIVGCTIQNHVARSILIKTRDVLIERNFIQNAESAAIKISAEAHWYEGASPKNVVIRNNRILNCNGAIQVYSDCTNPKGQSIFNVTVEDNIVDCSAVPNTPFFFRNVDGLKIRRNQICCNGAPVSISCCEHVESDIL